MIVLLYFRYLHHKKTLLPYLNRKIICIKFEFHQNISKEKKLPYENAYKVYYKLSDAVDERI